LGISLRGMTSPPPLGVEQDHPPRRYADDRLIYFILLRDQKRIAVSHCNIRRMQFPANPIEAMSFSFASSSAILSDGGPFWSILPPLFASSRGAGRFGRVSLLSWS